MPFSSLIAPRILHLICQSSRKCATNTVQPVQTQIQLKLKQAFQPAELNVSCESHLHNVPAGAEKHFRVLVVSSVFEGLALPKRHRLVYETLSEELNAGVHALRIDAFSLGEYYNETSDTARRTAAQPSPQCRGGGNK